jgi:hypothetical protein
VESALIGIVLTTVGELSVMNIVLATAVALDDANDAQEEDEEGKSEEHSNEPSCSSDAIVTWRRNYHTILKSKCEI